MSHTRGRSLSRSRRLSQTSVPTSSPSYRVRLPSSDPRTPRRPSAQPITGSQTQRNHRDQRPERYGDANASLPTPQSHLSSIPTPPTFPMKGRNVSHPFNGVWGLPTPDPSPVRPTPFITFNRQPQRTHNPSPLVENVVPVPTRPPSRSQVSARSSRARSELPSNRRASPEPPAVIPDSSDPTNWSEFLSPSQGAPPQLRAQARGPPVDSVPGVSTPTMQDFVDEAYFGQDPAEFRTATPHGTAACNTSHTARQNFPRGRRAQETQWQSPQENNAGTGALNNLNATLPPLTYRSISVQTDQTPRITHIQRNRSRSRHRQTPNEAGDENIPITYDGIPGGFFHQNGRVQVPPNGVRQPLHTHLPPHARNTVETMPCGPVPIPSNADNRAGRRSQPPAMGPFTTNYSMAQNPIAIPQYQPATYFTPVPSRAAPPPIRIVRDKWANARCAPLIDNINRPKENIQQIEIHPALSHGSPDLPIVDLRLAERFVRLQGSHKLSHWSSEHPEIAAQPATNPRVMGLEMGSDSTGELIVVTNSRGVTVSPARTQVPI
ncbi:hypothetical protein DL93DRAFT_2071587 [Clavulina sp. PMI_390]|nr:hypothetical protein DL93DRAFT_2071587 [Clavulina sp. PMI_390]